MLTFDVGHKRFNHRVAGACVHESHVLLAHAAGEDFWFFGGSVDFHEDSRSALRREIAEELGCEADVSRLLCVVEGFFPLAGRDYHVISFIYALHVSDSSVLKKSWTRNITDGGVHLSFLWFPLSGLEALNLQPAFLKDLLQNPPASTKHVVRRE